MERVTMLVLLIMLYPGLHVSSTSLREKSHTLEEYVALFKELLEGIIDIPIQSDSNIDHVDGLRKIADNSGKLASKAAQAAIFVTRDLYETEPTKRGTLLAHLVAVLDKAYESDVPVQQFDFLRASNGSTFDGVARDVRRAQFALSERYRGLHNWLLYFEDTTDNSTAALLTEFCTKPRRFDTTLCMLQVYGSIFGINCSSPYNSLCPFGKTYYDLDTEWTSPASVRECVNERVARLSANESTLNQLAMYAKRNALLAFNFISFCSALNENYDGVNPDSIQAVRSIADGFALSKKEIDLSSWPRLARAMSAKILTSAALKLSPGETDKSYNRTAHDIVAELKRSWFSHEYSAVVYYSYTGPLKSDDIFYKDSKKDSFDETAEGVKAFVKRYKPRNAERLKELWKLIEVDPRTLAKLFDDDESSTSMTERFRTAKLDAKLFGDSGFRAAAVIPCAYRFVWYELAWQYFHAYGTTSQYAITFYGKNAYKQCVVVVLFP